MIDLHSHILPGIDDGAGDLETSLQMARIAVADGITLMACTPHIYPGRWDNTFAEIKLACQSLRMELELAEIPLQLTTGADIQVVPELAKRLTKGELPTLNDSRYFLFEPPHHVSLPRIDEIISETIQAGFVPVITHPERLFYIEKDFDMFAECARNGAWIQLTAGSLTGAFGRKPKSYSERFLKQGLVHLLATDAHNTKNRRPELAKANKIAARYVGQEEADRMVTGRPQLILDDEEPDFLPLPSGAQPETVSSLGKENKAEGWLARLF